MARGQVSNVKSAPDKQTMIMAYLEYVCFTWQEALPMCALCCLD